MNGDYLDPRADNLEWCTHKHNTAHAISVLGRNFAEKLHGGKGELSSASKLTEAEVIEIKRLLREGKLQREIAAQFNTCSTNISSINRGHTWGHVQ
jgi:DNA-binding NarL/FixJ family response regulator